MVKLHCGARNCANNRDDLCVLEDIRVDGCEACREDQTCCLSFRARGVSYENAAGEPVRAVPETEIACDAARCVHHCGCGCGAASVRVGGDGACDCRETACETFQARLS